MNNINYETIISSFDDKGTLLKWLKTIDAELQGAKVTSSSWRVVEGEESNTAYLTLTTSDGVNFETEGLVIPKTTSAMIIDIINQAIAIYDADFSGSTTLEDFVENMENRLDYLETKTASIGATEGQVLTSNGDGTSAWKDASGGGSKLYKHDLIMPISITIDSSTLTYKIVYSIISSNASAFTQSTLSSYFSSIFGSNKVLLNSYMVVSGGPTYKGVITLEWGTYGPPTLTFFARIASVDETKFTSTTNVIGNNFTDVITEL